MDFERNRRFESVFSKKVRAGKRRTYFFDVRKTRGNDFYLTITESKRRFDGDSGGGYERHKIFLYKEDFNRFIDCLTETVDHIKTELLPDYDYDEYTRRHEEFEEKMANGTFEKTERLEKVVKEETKEETPASMDVTETFTDLSADDEDLSW